LKGILLLGETISSPSRRSRGLATRTWSAFGRLVSASHLLAWADQAVVSAASFLALVMIGRFTDAGQLGVYALGNSLIVMLLWTQESVTRVHTRSSSIARLALPPNTHSMHCS
jgi:hypothetical protein